MPSVPPRDEGFVFANRSGRSETDLGIDRSAAQVLEVAEIWSGTVVDVQHFKDGDAVTLGDRDRPSSHRLSGLLVAALVLGVGGFMLAHARLAPPPLLPDGDADRMEAWELARAEARAAADPDAALEEPRSPDVELPGDLLLQPAWESTLADVVLPEAERLAATGGLPSEWRSFLSSVPPAYDLFDDLAEPRVVGDLPLGTRVVVDDEVRTVVAGRFGTLQALVESAPVALAGSDRRYEVDGSTEVALWAPAPAEVQALTALHHRVATALFQDAEASGSSRARCRAAEGLAAHEARFDLFAIQARCAADRGRWEAVAEALDRAAALDPGEPMEPIGSLTPERHRELTLGMLDAAARRALIDAFPSEGESDPAAVDAAEAAHVALRDFVVSTAHDAAVLRSVDDGIHRIASHRLQEQQSVHVRRAVVLGAFILLLLPLGWRLDERRAARRGASFRVDGAALPSDPFPLVERDGLAVPVDVPGTLMRGDEELSTEELVAAGRMSEGDGVRRLTLRDDERFVARFGATTFLVHRVPAAKAVAGARASNFDTLYLGILAALLFVGASLGVHLMTSEYEVTHQFVEEIPRITVFVTPEDEKKLEAPQAKPTEAEPNPGAKPKDDPGRVGAPDEILKKARGARTAVKRMERDRSIAEKAGILADIDDVFAKVDMFGGGGEMDRATANLGILGTQYGRQWGSRGYTPGGDGPGGGGSAETLDGWGTDGIPGGGGDPKSIGGWHDHREPPKGPKGDDGGIVIGEIDKSIIDRIVKQHLNQFRFCYERELQRSPELHGKIVMKWVIAKDGSVSSSSVKRSTMKNPVVEACMVSRVRRLRFPAPRGGGIVLVSYPFVFNAR